MFMVMFMTSVGYDATDVDDILEIHNYLMKKNDIV